MNHVTVTGNICTGWLL